MRSSTSSFKGLLAIALLVVAVLAVDRLTSAGLQRLLHASGFRLAKLYDGRAEADIAAFGNSRAVHTFYGPALGAGSCERVVNFAYNGLSMGAVEALIRDYIDLNPAPKAMLLELSGLYALGGGDAQLTPFMADGTALRARLLDQEGGTASLWNGAFQSLRFNSPMTVRALAYLGRGDQGWINRLSPIRQPGKAPPPGIEKRRYTIDPESVAALERIIALTAERGIELIPVIAPYHPTVTRQIDSPYAWIEYVQARFGNSVDILDLSRALPGDAEFQDFQHLNIIGARALADQFNARIAGTAGCQAAGSTEES